MQIPRLRCGVILHTEAEALNALLAAIGPDRGLVSTNRARSLLGGPPGTWKRPCALPGIAQTKATKLIARKRPRLYPIWDSVVSQVLGTARAHLNPVREALRADDGALHHRLLSIRGGVPMVFVKPLRGLDSGRVPCS